MRAVLELRGPEDAAANNRDSKAEAKLEAHLRALEKRYRDELGDNAYAAFSRQARWTIILIPMSSSSEDSELEEDEIRVPIGAFSKGSGEKPAAAFALVDCVRSVSKKRFKRGPVHACPAAAMRKIEKALRSSWRFNSPFALEQRYELFRRSRGR